MNPAEMLQQCIVATMHSIEANAMQCMLAAAQLTFTALAAIKEAAASLLAAAKCIGQYYWPILQQCIGL